MLGNIALQGPIPDKNMMAYKSLSDLKPDQKSSDNGRGIAVPGPKNTSPYKDKMASRNISPINSAHKKNALLFTIMPKKTRMMKKSTYR